MPQGAFLAKIETTAQQFFSLHGKVRMGEIGNPRKLSQTPSIRLGGTIH